MKKTIIVQVLLSLLILISSCSRTLEIPNNDSAPTPNVNATSPSVKPSEPLAKPSPTREISSIIPSVVGGTPSIVAPTTASSKKLASDDSVEMGKKYLEDGDYKNAIETLDRIIANDPRNSEAFALRGKARFELQDYEGCRDDLERALELDPNNADAYYFRGIYKQNIQDSSAIQDFTTAIKLNPHNADAYFRRGSLNQNNKATALAKRDYKKALELDPNGEVGKMAKDALNEMKRVGRQ